MGPNARCSGAPTADALGAMTQAIKAKPANGSLSNGREMISAAVRIWENGRGFISASLFPGRRESIGRRVGYYGTEWKHNALRHSFASYRDLQIDFEYCVHVALQWRALRVRIA